MAQIDILVVVDAQTLAETKPGGSAGSPINLGAWSTSDAYVYMIAKNSYVISQQAKSELNVSANSGDIIRWTITSPTRGQTYNTLLYGFTTDSPDSLTPPQMLDVTLNLYMPENVNDPTGPRKKVRYEDYLWQAVILKPGVKITYHWSFMVIDNNNNVKGYYNWDPFITVG